MSETDIPRELSRLLQGRVLVITGAGVSADSGIPTFRGSDGLWRKFDPRQLATQSAFDRDAELVWEWYGERRANIRAAAPNPGHHALAQLTRNTRGCLIATQNVDDLHERAGTPADRLVHVHGDIFVSRCTDPRCGFATRADGPPLPPPRCPQCQSLLRPGVVWFDERLDPVQIGRIERFLDTEPVDLTLIVGTTAVFPYIIDWATRDGSLVEINPEPTTVTRHARWSFRHRAADLLPRLIAAA